MKFVRFWLPVLLGIGMLAQPLCAAEHPVPAVQDTETKEQRDARMGWWREARFGMFIHWGLYAIPAGEWGSTKATYGEWLMHKAKIPVAEYQPLTAKFNPVKFDADAWVAVAKAAGMKYIVITAKHHDGFAMFKSAASSFNIVDATQFKRDPLQELAAACQRQGIKLGFYYSQDQDWTAPGGSTLIGEHWDKAQDGDFSAYLKNKAIPQLKELLTNYQPYPAIIWFDTPTKNMTPELAAQIVTLLNQYPNLIWNNRLGGTYPGDTETPEQGIPPQGFPGKDWETCMTINDTWGYTKNVNFKSTEVLLRNLIDIASKGGNYLLNVGPDANGEIPQPEIDRLLEIGKWLNANGEAIYDTSASPFSRRLAWGRATQKPGKLFLSVFDWPKDGKLIVPLESPVDKVYLLAQPQTALTTESTSDGLQILLPATAPDPMASVVVVEHSKPLVVNMQRILPDANGEVVATGLDATVFGSGIRVGHVGEIGYWTNAKDYVEWPITLKKAGDYKVSMEYATITDSKLTIALDGNNLVVEPAKTGGWAKYVVKDCGVLNIAKAGDLTLKVSGEIKSGNAVVNLKKITLTPVKK